MKCTDYVHEVVKISSVFSAFATWIFPYDDEGKWTESLWLNLLRSRLICQTLSQKKNPGA